MTDPQDPVPVPEGLRRAEAGWLGERLGVAVRGFEEEVIGAGRGLISTTWRLVLDTDPPGLATDSLVLKSETSNEAPLPARQSVAVNQRSRRQVCQGWMPPVINRRPW